MRTLLVGTVSQGAFWEETDLRNPELGTGEVGADQAAEVGLPARFRVTDAGRSRCWQKTNGLYVCFLDSLSLSSVSFAAIELKSANSCAPVETTGRGVVLVGVPERTIILRIN